MFSQSRVAFSWKDIIYIYIRSFCCQKLSTETNIYTKPLPYFYYIRLIIYKQSTPNFIIDWIWERDNFVQSQIIRVGTREIIKPMKIRLKPLKGFAEWSARFSLLLFIYVFHYVDAQINNLFAAHGRVDWLWHTRTYFWRSFKFQISNTKTYSVANPSRRI